MVTALAVAPDGSWLASAGGFDNAVWVWDLAGEPVPRLLDGHTSQVTSLAISPDGARLASAGGLDGSIRIWAAAGWRQAITAQAATVLSARDAEVWSLAWTADGDRLVAGRGDGTVDVWDVPSAHRLSSFSGGSNSVNAVAMTASQWVVAGESGGMIRVWDTVTADRPTTLAGHNQAMASVAALGPGPAPPGACPPVGPVLVTGDSRGRVGSDIRLWACPSGVIQQQIAGHLLSITSILPDIMVGRMITASSDGSVRIWRLPEGTEEAALYGHDGGVWAIAAARSGWLATAGGFDGSVLIWDLAERVAVTHLPGHDGGVWALCAAGDGRWLVTGDR